MIRLPPNVTWPSKTGELEMRYVNVEGVEYDVDTERAAATRALLAAGESEERVYTRDTDGERIPTVTVLRDSGTLHQVTGR